MATDPKERKQEQEQERPREAGAEHEKSENADQAKEGMPGYGQPPEEVRKPLPEQDW